jgi:hypothetical protein
MRTKMMIAFSFLGIMSLTSVAQTVSPDYFGQTPPGDKAVKFAPGIISLPNRNEINITFSPDGNEVYFESNTGIYFTKRVNNSWTNQVIEPMFNGFSTPFLSADGKKIYLIKYFDIGTPNITCEAWMSERTTGEWGVPQSLPAPFNTASSDDAYFSGTVDGVNYIESNRAGGYGKSDIWCVRPSSNQAENLGPNVNSASDDGSPCIALDGSYLIFGSDRKGGCSYNGYDYYVSFNKGNNEWTTPVNMERSGAGINLAKYVHISPSLSPDGKFFFFNRHTWTEPLEYPDIYWVSTHILDTLKTIAFSTVSVKETVKQNAILFPNPTTGQFSISFGSTPKLAVAEIYNTEGKLVLKKIFKNAGNAVFDLNDFSKGVYVLMLNIDGKKLNKKFCLD